MSNFQLVSKRIANVSVIEMCQLTTIGAKTILSLDETPVSLKFILKKCTVKYMPDKFDKLVLTLDEECLEELKNFQNILSKEGIENFIKDETISLKVNTEQKKLLKNINTQDILNVSVDFNDIWTLNDKKFVSLKLNQFKRIRIELDDLLD
jgi:hypothetical protein